jgi:hypothetical protein
VGAVGVARAQRRAALGVGGRARGRASTGDPWIQIGSGMWSVFAGNLPRPRICNQKPICRYICKVARHRTSSDEDEPDDTGARKFWGADAGIWSLPSRLLPNAQRRQGGGGGG